MYIVCVRDVHVCMHNVTVHVHVYTYCSLIVQVAFVLSYYIASGSQATTLRVRVCLVVIIFLRMGNIDATS